MRDGFADGFAGWCHENQDTSRAGLKFYWSSAEYRMMLSPEIATFTERARAWLSLTPRGTPSPRVINWPGGRLVIAEFVNCPDRHQLAEALLVRGQFVCGRNCEFSGPVFVAGNVEAGRGSRFDCIATDGSLVAASDVEIKRWAWAKRIMELRAGASVGGEAISDGAIRLGIGARVGRLHGPEITTTGFTSGSSNAPLSASLLDVPPASGFWQGKLSPLGSDTWVCEGDLHVPAPVRLRVKLVVRGNFSCPAGSVIDDDIKTGGSLHVGSASVCQGRLTALGDLTLDEGTLFSGSLQASGTLRLAKGVRGFRAGGPVLVESGELILEPNVCVRGSLKTSRGAVARDAVQSDDLAFLLA